MIAITGADGFIGSHLFKYLLKKGIKARKINRSGDDNSIAIGNLSSKTDWFIALENIETLVHCASIPNFVNKGTSSIDELNEVNIEATRNMAEQASKMGVKRIIFISTIKVNGEVTLKNQKFNELSKPNPQEPYAISKFEAENILKSISQKNNIELLIIRSPIVYGEFVKGNFLTLINLVYNAIPLPLNKINNSRSIIYVGNLVYLIYLCIINKDLKSKTLLVSDNQSISTRGLVKLLAKKLRKRILFFYLPKFLMIFIFNFLKKRNSLSSFIDSLEIDSRESYRFLNAKLPFTTEEGIKKTIKWFMEQKT